MSKDFFPEISLCSERVMNKVLKYKIDRDQYGTARVYVPEDDDYYNLAAFIQYLEDKTESSEDSEDSESLQTTQPLNVMNNKNSNVLPQNTRNTMSSSRQISVNNNIVHANFCEKVKYLVKKVTLPVDDIEEVISRVGFIMMSFKVSSWAPLSKREQVEKLVDLFSTPGINVPHLFSVRTCINPYKREIVQLDPPCKMNRIWATVEQRLNNLMTSAAKARIQQFLKVYEIYKSVAKHDPVISFEDAGVAFLKNNYVEVEVNLKTKIGDYGVCCVGSRIYREFRTLTPLVNKETLESAKMKYFYFNWK